MKRRDFLQNAATAGAVLGYVPPFLSGAGGAKEQDKKAGRPPAQGKSMDYYIVRNREPQAVILMPGTSSEDDRFVASELQRYIQAMTGAEIPVRSEAPRSNELIETFLAVGQRNGSLSADGFEIRTKDESGRRIVFLGGGSARGALYAAYDFLERLGVVFRSTDDILPSLAPDLVCPKVDVRREPAFAFRGLNFWGNHHASSGHWALADFCRAIDQMAKMKFNQILWHWFPWEPALSYEFRGERNLVGDLAPAESGYAFRRAVTKSFSTRDIEIGRERFTNAWFAPPELQGCPTPEEAYRISAEKFRAILAHARRRYIDVAFGFEPLTFPPNIARHLKRLEPLPFQTHMGTYVCPTHPATREANEVRLRAFFELYPEANSLCLWISEIAVPCQCPECQAMQEKYLPHFGGVEKLFEHYPRANPEVLRGDIGYLHLFLKLMEVRDRLRPKTKLIIAGVGREYLFPYFDKLVPREVPFASLSSRAFAAPKGLMMELFHSNVGRDVWVVGRHDDDGNMVGLQFNVAMMHKDRLFEGGKENGVTGQVFQFTKLRGNEHNAQYLAECSWDPALSPAAFYEKYLRRVFGAGALPLVSEAYRLLEETEEYLGWRGRFVLPGPGNGSELAIMRLFRNDPNPFDGPHRPTPNTGGDTSPEKFQHEWSGFLEHCRTNLKLIPPAIDRLERAAGGLTAATEHIAGKPAAELRYLASKTRAWITALEATLALDGAYLAFDDAFQRREGVSHEQFLSRLAEAEKLATEAPDLARQTARLWAEHATEPEDLGALFSLNKRWVAGIAQVEQFIKNIVNFHSGRPYWTRIDWETLFPRMIG